MNNLVALGIGEVRRRRLLRRRRRGLRTPAGIVRPPGNHARTLPRTSSRVGRPSTASPWSSSRPPPRELGRLDSKNWTATPDDLSEDLAARVARPRRPRRCDPADGPGGPGRVGRRDHGRAARRPIGARTAPGGLIVLADSRRGLGEYPPLAFKMNAAELARMAGGSSDRRRAEACRRASRPADRPCGVRHDWPSEGSSGHRPAASPEHVAAFPSSGRSTSSGRATPCRRTWRRPWRRGPTWWRR